MIHARRCSRRTNDDVQIVVEIFPLPAMLGEARGAWMALATMADTTGSGVQRTNSTLDGASTKCPSGRNLYLNFNDIRVAVLFSLARQFLAFAV